MQEDFTPAEVVDELEELEELLVEREKLVDALATPKMPIVDDLESLLTESVALKNKDIRVKQAKAAQAKGFIGFSKEEAALCNAIVEAWEVEKNWTPVQDIAVFERQACQCGNHTEVFDRFLQRQAHKRTTAVRWVTVDEDGLTDYLPRASAFREVQVTMCSFCAQEYEFSAEDALPLEDLLKGEVVVQSEGK
jgi:hypothetical protein